MVTTSVPEYISRLLIDKCCVTFRYNLLRKKFPPTSFTGSPVLSDSGFDLLNKLLTYDPEKVILDLHVVSCFTCCICRMTYLVFYP